MYNTKQEHIKLRQEFDPKYNETDNKTNNALGTFINQKIVDIKITQEDMPDTKLFTKEEDIKSKIIRPLINAFVSSPNTELVIKTLKENHTKVCPALVNPYHDKDKIKELLSAISEKVDSVSEKQISIFNELFDLAEAICDKPLSTDGKWYSYSEIHANLQYMHLFTEFLGEVNTDFENIKF